VRFLAEESCDFAEIISRAKAHALLGGKLGDKMVTIVRGFGWAAVAAHRRKHQ
jgi:hypothetical protein